MTILQDDGIGRADVVDSLMVQSECLEIDSFVSECHFAVFVGSRQEAHCDQRHLCLRSRTNQKTSLALVLRSVQLVHAVKSCHCRRSTTRAGVVASFEESTVVEFSSAFLVQHPDPIVQPSHLGTLELAHKHMLEAAGGENFVPTIGVAVVETEPNLLDQGRKRAVSSIENALLIEELVGRLHFLCSHDGVDELRFFPSFLSGDDLGSVDVGKVVVEKRRHFRHRLHTKQLPPLSPTQTEQPVWRLVWSAFRRL